MKALLLTSVFMLSSSFAMASSHCAELKEELAAMTKAQEQIMNSLISNHETFASSMEEYSENITAAKGGAAAKSVAQDMNQSAKAFRARGVQGKRTAEKLNEASEDLIARVATCLK